LYKIILSDEAEKDYLRISKANKKFINRVDSAFEKLRIDPKIGKMLSGNLRGLYSFRVGNYRIIYEIQNFEISILIITIGHRKEVYKEH